MSKSFNDLRVNVLSFNEAINGLDIAVSQNILWPCHTFSIVIPQKKKSPINIFEETVLKLTELDSGSTDSIARLMCLERDLVSFIQEKLHSLQLLNSRYALTEDGKELLQEWRNRPGDRLKNVDATVFVDLLSGKLLPYVHTKELQYADLHEINGQRDVVFALQRTDEKKIKAKKIGAEKDFIKTIPDAYNVVAAIKEFKRKFKQYQYANPSNEESQPYIPQSSAVQILPAPKLIYLHCKILIQKGNVNELLVTNGFGYGFSENFSHYLGKQDWKWLAELKSKGCIETFDTEDATKGSTQNKSWIFPSVTKLFLEAQKDLEYVRNVDIGTSHQKEKRTRCMYNIVKQLYTSLEWALRIVVSDNQNPAWEDMLSSSYRQDNQKYLESFAKDIGFKIIENKNFLLAIAGNKIRAQREGKPEMQSLLALAIVGAHNSAMHPLHRVVAVDKNFLRFIYKLKSQRDAVVHGDSPDINDNYIDVIFGRTSRAIIALLPEITNDFQIENAPRAIQKDNESIAQLNLKARAALDIRLGHSFMTSLSTELRDKILPIEFSESIIQDDIVDAQVLISELCAALQLFLIDAFKNRSLENPNQYSKQDAIDVIISFGFYTSTNSVPKSISKVKDGLFYQALQAQSATLGAHLLALFILGNHEELQRIYTEDPSFVSFVSHLISLRGHANTPCPLSKDERISLKNTTFTTLKMISEVFNG